MNVAVLIVVGMLVVGALVGCLWLCSRHGPGAERLQSRCPRCGQKVRYAANRVGRAFSCPLCRFHWTLPAASQTVREPRTVYRVRRR
jgi:hypothetical protein